MQLQNLVLIVVTLLLTSLTGAQAQSLHGTITFDNQSGEPALVKLIGPTSRVVEVPHGQTQTVNVGPGEYYLLARYGTDPSQYTYSHGDPFKVEETGTRLSVITITLHKVVGGNYPTRATSREEFDKVVPVPKGPEGERQSPPMRLVSFRILFEDGRELLVQEAEVVQQSNPGWVPAQYARVDKLGFSKRTTALGVATEEMRDLRLADVRLIEYLKNRHLSDSS